jgi:hypothetical protein
MAHGSTFTQLSLTQPLMAPPQNNSHIYLVDEIINNPQNNQVPPLPFQPQIHLVNTPIIPQVPHPHINLNLNSILNICLFPFPSPLLPKLIINKNPSYDDPIVPLYGHINKVCIYGLFIPYI